MEEIRTVSNISPNVAPNVDASKLADSGVAGELAAVREQLAEIGRVLARTMLVEYDSRDSKLPPNTRESIAQAISMELHLEKKLIGLQKKYSSPEALKTNSIDIGFGEAGIESGMDYWDGMIESGDYYHSHQH